jgi:hypothetical protein
LFRRLDDKHSAGERLEKAVGWACSQDATFVEDDHLCAALGLIKISGTYENAQSLIVNELVDDLPQLAAGQWVDAGRGLIEE